MKYKQVFFIWLIADLFLALGLLSFVIYELFTGGNANDMEMFFWVLLYGFVVSLPSLLLMTLFHFIFIKNAKTPANYPIPYIALIISINILYLLMGQFGFGMTGEFNVFYIGSTLAGLIAFYVVDKQIKKTAAAKEKNTVVDALEV